MNLTIGKEILAALLCTALLPTGILGIYGGLQLKRFLDKEIINYNQELVRQAGRKLDYLAEDIATAQKQLIVHTISSPLFFQYSEIPLSERIREIKDTNSFLDTLRQVYPFIESIYLIDNHQRVYSSLLDFDREKLLSSSWVEELFNQPYGYRIIPLHIAGYAAASEDDPVSTTISFVRKVTRMGNPEEGTLIQIDLEERLIAETLEEYPLGSNGYIMLLDGDGQVLGSSMGEGGIIPPVRRGMQEFSFTLENFDWTLVARLWPKELFYGRGITLWIFMVLVFSILVLSVFFSIVVSRRITGPLHRVIDAMEQMGSGDFSRRLPEVANSDLRSLVKGINRMSDHLQVLITNIARKEEEKNRAQMNALQAQINPHFLYNTLDVIRGISQAQGNQEVVDITASLAKVFRFSIGTKEVVTVARELENIEHYLKIQEYRFGDRFRVEYQIEEGISECPTVKLILQPLVENAFKYGLEECRRDGLLVIRGKRVEDLILLSVENNGPDIDPLRAEEINAKFRNGIAERNVERVGGMGLYNVDARLKLHFGYSSGVFIKSRIGGGTEVTLTFPYRIGIEED